MNSQKYTTYDQNYSQEIFFNKKALKTKKIKFTINIWTAIHIYEDKSTIYCTTEDHLTSIYQIHSYHRIKYNTDQQICHKNLLG